MDLFYRLLRAGARIRYDPRCLVHHARATRQGRLARRAPYGHGIGAAVAIWLRERDAYALVILGRWLDLRLRRLLEGIFRRNRILVYEEALVLAGTARGLLFGARVDAARLSSYEPAASRPWDGSRV
jgi:GT2 family glycosyltransferase